MFAVHPIDNCPHLKDFFSQEKTPSRDDIKFPPPCTTCQDTSENWVCLKCYSIGCSRYVNSHQEAHYKETSHCIALSFSDLSVWCYQCDSYIKHPTLSNVLKLMSEVKFGTNNENIIVNSDTSSSDQAYNNETSDSDEEEEIPLELLKQMMGVQIGSTSTPVTYKTNLEEVTVEGIAKAIKQGKCKNIIVMSGAGISVSAGIPDFRTPGTGLYDNLQKYNLPHATAVFEIDYFRQRPDPFYLLAKELFPGNFKPTPTHYFVKLLEKKGILLRNYTQNIDTLERVAGISGDKLVEAHGSFATSHCIDCNKEETTEAVKKHVENGTIPHCSACGGLVKPDIVFFGESLPSRFFQLLNDDFAKCDLLLVLGTSLQVQPFASLIGKVPNECPRLLINRELVGTIDKKYGELLANSPKYFRFDMESNYRDVALLGDCDSGVLKLADLCGWKQELDLLINSPSTNNNISL